MFLPLPWAEDSTQRKHGQKVPCIPSRTERKENTSWLGGDRNPRKASLGTWLDKQRQDWFLRTPVERADDGAVIRHDRVSAHNKPRTTQNTAEDIYCQRSIRTSTWKMVPLTEGTHVPALKAALLGRQRLECRAQAAAATLDVSGDLRGSPTQIPGPPGESMPWQ